MKKIIAVSIIFWISMNNLVAQKPVGIFENHTDVGKVQMQGSAVFDVNTKTYALTGSGQNIWFDKDEFHFAYKKITGDFLVTTQPNLVGKGIDPHRKSGWMARTSTDTSSAMVILTVHGDGLTAFQYRKKNNTNIEEVKIPVLGAEIIQLERRGRSFHIAVSKIGQPTWTVEIPDFDFPKELLTGLFICSHNKSVSETVVFSNTRIFVPLPNEK